MKVLRLKSEKLLYDFYVYQLMYLYGSPEMQNPWNIIELGADVAYEFGTGVFEDVDSKLFDLAAGYVELLFDVEIPDDDSVVAIKNDSLMGWLKHNARSNSTKNFFNL